MIEAVLGLTSGIAILVGTYWVYGREWLRARPGGKGRWGWLLLAYGLVAQFVGAEDPITGFVTWVLCVLMSRGFIALDDWRAVRKETKRLFDNEGEWR